MVNPPKNRDRGTLGENIPCTQGFFVLYCMERSRRSPSLGARAGARLGKSPCEREDGILFAPPFAGETGSFLLPSLPRAGKRINFNGEKRGQNMTTIKLNDKRAKLVAHRGLSSLEKENTCSAFVAAGNRDGIFGIETDVHRTADGKYVIIHDDNTQRVALDHLEVEKSTFETLRSLRLLDLDGRRGRADLMLPTVEEYIGICKRYEKTCVFEFKNPMAEEDIAALVETFRREGYLDHVIFISFQPGNLIALRKHYPDLPAQILLENWVDGALEQMVKYHLDLDIDFRALTKELVEEVHKAGLLVNCWTVNTLEDAHKVLEMGVDFITTNTLE